MPPGQNDNMLDAALNYLKNNVTALTVCNAQPTTYAEATTPAPAGFRLATVVVGAGDFTLADGDIDGRKVTVAEQASMPISATGESAYIALVTTSSTTLQYWTTCEAAALTSGGTVTVPAWDIELADAA